MCNKSLGRRLTRHRPERREMFGAISLEASNKLAQDRHIYVGIGLQNRKNVGNVDLVKILDVLFKKPVLADRHS